MIMCRKLILLVCLIFVWGLFLTNIAQAELVGWWMLDEGTGMTAYDSSGNGFDGTLIDDARWIAGKYGAAVELDGTGDCVEIPPIGINSDTVTMSAWIKRNGSQTDYAGVFFTRNMPTNDLACGLMMLSGGTSIGYTWNDNTQATWGWVSGLVIPDNEWCFVALVVEPTQATVYVNEDYAVNSIAHIAQEFSEPLWLGQCTYSADRFFNGQIDDARIYDQALSEVEVQAVMYGGEGYPFALGPDPADGSIHPDTWATLSWKPGDYAASHDIYIGENFDDVNDATRDSDVFRGNQGLGLEFYIAGFAPYAYPDGLVNGTTYYWRIDEVNEADPNSPWKGPVWSFTVPPKTAYFPDPVDNAEFVDLNVTLRWTAGSGAKLHFIVFGEDFDEVQNAAAGTPNGTTSYRPGALQLAKTYYWRVDESDGFETYKGDVWSFTTVGAVSGPNPADGAVDVKPSVILEWVAGAVAESHDVYFGMDADAVKNATKASAEYKGPKALGEESYDPGKLTLNTAYFWRIDEVNSTNPDSPWEGNVWSFATGDYFVIDDFEAYDANDNQIWYAWHDGLGAGAQGTPDYLPGNGTGSAVGDEATASYTEETIVHGGNQSMPIVFDNNKQGFAKYSEVELTLADQRDWTEEGVVNLSLWFRGNPPSVGSFAEGPVGTYTMTASGTDIWDVGPADGQYHDEFHFAYKMLTGIGSIQAKVESLDETDPWAKAGVMIRETLNGNSKHAMMIVSAASGVSFQRRPETGGASAADTTADLAAPYWVKIERDLAGNFSAYSSADGVSWQKVGLSEPIQMATNVYIGLAVTSHDAALTCQAVLTNVTTTGNVTGQWASQDIGIESNDAEPLYVAVSNSTGAPAVIVHEDPAAAQINQWTQWIIPLQDLADLGITLTNVDRIAIGLGTQGNTTVPGGKGKMYIDDIRLLQPAPEPEPKP
jgi:hypothetical protein